MFKPKLIAAILVLLTLGCCQQRSAGGVIQQGSF